MKRETTEEFEARMGEPTANYKKRNPNEKSEAQFQKEIAALMSPSPELKLVPPDEFNLKNGLLALINANHSSINYTSISNVYNLMVAQNITLDMEQQILELYAAQK